MKLSNFKLTGRTGTRLADLWLYGTVDVTAGFWIFKRTETKLIFRTYGDLWLFADSHADIDQRQIYQLERQYLAKQGCGIKNCPLETP